MSAVELGWPRFAFFDKTATPSIPDNLSFKELAVHCWHSGNGFALFGERNGGVFTIKRDKESEDPEFWKLYKEELGDVAISGNYLATVGENEPGINSLLTIWNMEKGDKFPPSILCQKVSNVANAQKAAKATMVTVNSEMDFIVVGFNDGSAAFASADLKKDRSLKWTKLCDASSNSEGISGVVIASVPKRPERVVFVITESAVTTFVILNKTIKHHYRHEGRGCSRNCYTFSEHEDQLIVAGRDMMHFFKVEACLDAAMNPSNDITVPCKEIGKGVEKLQVIALDNYTAVLTKHKSMIQEDKWMTILTVYDLKECHIAFSCSMPSLARIFKIDSLLYIIQGDGSLFRLTEKHINAKLDILYRKNLFNVAARIARSSGSAELPHICLKYGDYLYKKGDYENAVQQYCETIGTVEPSYVIKKFLDGAKITHLCKYLEALHKKKLEIGHHTTILLNCYSRLGAADKIRAFIDEYSVEGGDIDTAIKVLRSAKFFAEAEKLSKTHGRYSTYINILIEDMQKYSAAVQFLGTQPEQFAIKELEQFGKLLLMQCPDETIDLLIKIISGEGESQVSELMKMFVDDNANCAKFIKKALKSDTSNAAMRNTVLELMLKQLKETEPSNAPTLKAEIMQLIEQSNHGEAIHLCLMFGFAEGIIHIYRKQRRFTELMQFLKEKGDVDNMTQLCTELSDGALWTELLIYLSQCEDSSEDQVKKVLAEIEDSGIIHPLVVLEILSRSESLTVDSLRGYVVRWLQRQNEKVNNDAGRMEEVEKEIENLEYNIQTFQMSKCSICDQSLENDAIHFFCKHSYHVNCFSSYSDHTNKCPACSSTRPIFRTDEVPSEVSTYQQFREQADNSTDIMTVMSDYLRSGLFSSNSAGKADDRSEKSSSVNPFDEPSNPFEDEEPTAPSPIIQKRRSPVQSNRKAPASKPVSTNPFDDYDDAMNPFA
uniref:Vacuolar protein sorting-associated protein 11 homolog n=1 Tax=Steinernema glaseri TaxID=37863 RepID=A0A1I7XZ03_9BILA